MNNEGWICPKCDRSVSPARETCPCSEPVAVPSLPWPMHTQPAPFQFTPRQQPCLIEEYFRANPNAGAACISCSCPRCSVYC